MALKDWKKNIVHEFEGNLRYEYVKEPYTIDVHSFREQGHAGSNQVNVYGGSHYGGWLLGTPKSFKTKAQADRFAKDCINKLDKGIEGKRVPFAD